MARFNTEATLCVADCSPPLPELKRACREDRPQPELIFAWHYGKPSAGVAPDAGRREKGLLSGLGVRLATLAVTLRRREGGK